MNIEATARNLVLAALVAIAAGGCANAPFVPPNPAQYANPTPGSVLRSAKLDPALEDRILALNPERVSDADVREALALGPTPRIFGMHGGIYPVHLLMESFGQFLIGMGYPENRVRDAEDGAYSHSPYESSEKEAGLIAWYYEHEGMRPVLIGHSQGGIQAVKVLHELAGSFGAALHPFNPLTGQFEPRTTILDPLTGRERPVVGISVASVSVVGTGGWALALPIHWGALSLIRTIPDTVDDFTGYRIGFDVFAWDAPWLEDLKTFHAAGKATVRNVTLPAEYSHVFVPGTAQLAEDPAMRAWINAYDPNDEASRTPPPLRNAENVLFAADVWHTIKRSWALEAQRFVRARRALPPG